jgi:hypothetical protein
MEVFMKKVKEKTLDERAQILEEKKSTVEQLLATKKAEYEASIAGIKTELKSIKEEQEALREEKLNAKITYIREHADVILPLFKHDRTSCSDTNVNNGFGSRGDNDYRCAKCALIELIQHEAPESEIEDIDFSVQFFIK